jgi:ubiquinone/menaquinone biosynthesis C-methylase UbiE
MDLCEPLLALGRTHADARGLAGRVRFVRGDVQDMPFDDAAFDAAVSIDTLHVVASPVAMLNECERVLKPRGVLAIKNIRRSWLAWLDGVFRTAYTAGEVRELVGRSRLRACKVRCGVASLWIEAAARPAGAEGA